MKRATSGAKSQRTRSGDAATSDDGLCHATSTATDTASSGDASIVFQNIARGDFAAMPKATCAALVHCSRRFRVIVCRTSVRTMASITTDASKGRNVIERAPLSRLARCIRRQPTSAGNIGARRIPRTPRVHSEAFTGSQIQPSTSSTRKDGLVRLRRRLSAIFHRSMSASLFF
jgi:hypothetical protein